MKRFNPTPLLPAYNSIKRKFFTAFIFSILVSQLSAQVSPQGNWTWMKGNDVFVEYDSISVTDTASVPNIRSGSLTWTDADGNLWLFGGQVGLKRSYPPHMPKAVNDLWIFNPSNNRWTWLAGALNSTDIMETKYGQQGIASKENNPGPRMNCYSWTAKDGSLWFYDPYSTEFWKYEISTRFWTWVKGDASQENPVYGLIGIPADQNTPGRKFDPACWIDSIGNLWLMSGSKGNDLWKYEPTSNNWSLINGDPFFTGNPVYGLRGSDNSSNSPGVRSGAATWKDLNGNLWMMGGTVLKNGLLWDKYHDLWKYQAGTNTWTWMAGDSSTFRASFFGEKGIESNLAQPGGRSDVLTWEDKNGNFWTMGGEGYIYDSIDWQFNLNELWMFNPRNLKWTWVSGGINSNETNIPSPTSGSFGWMDMAGNLWMMGGVFSNRVAGGFWLNDLWRFSDAFPVLANDIISFTAKRENIYASIKWSVENETDIKAYTLQRKYNNAPGFENIAFVAPHNANNASNNYAYSDPNTSNSPSYYRLIQITKTGKEITSEIRMVEGLKQGFDITVFPNPSSGEPVNILFNNKQPKNIRLLSANGSVIRQWINYTPGQLTIYKLKAGAYILQVSDAKNTRTISRKMVVVQ